ncbi:MAG: hypothetical protein ABR583_02625 [Gaiellaceae bacterium]
MRGLALVVFAVAVFGIGSVVFLATHEDGPAEPRVLRLSFVLSGAFGDQGVVATKGPRFSELVRVLPSPLPERRPRPERSEDCYPAVLTIELSDGVRHRYGPCERPRSLVDVSLKLCRLLDRPGTDCDRLRGEGAPDGEPV